MNIMTDKFISYDVYVKIINAYLKAITPGIIPPEDNYSLLYWLAAMGMLDTLEIMGVEVVR